MKEIIEKVKLNVPSIFKIIVDYRRTYLNNCCNDNDIINFVSSLMKKENVSDLSFGSGECDDGSNFEYLLRATCLPDDRYFLEHILTSEYCNKITEIIKDEWIYSCK